MITTPDSLLDAALECAVKHKYNYRGFETPEKSVAAVRRRCTGIDKSDATNALERAGAMYKRAEWIVHERRRDMTSQDRAAALAPELASEFPEFSAATTDAALRWAWFWQIER